MSRSLTALSLARVILCATVLTGGAWVPLGPAVAQGETAAAQNELRLQQLEDQIRSLTGEVETQNHQISVLTQQLEKMRSDTDLRLNDLEGKSGGAPSAPALGPSQEESATPSGAGTPTPQYGAPTPLLPGALAPPRYAPQPAQSQQYAPQPYQQQQYAPQQYAPQAAYPQQQYNQAQAGPGGPPRNLGTIPAGSVPITPEQEDAAARAASVAGMTPEAQYQAAYALVNQGRYADAEQAFRAFLAGHPKDALASSAAYWVGHSYYATGDFQSAAVAFADGYKKYPKGIKAPDTLLDLGRTLAKLGSTQDACATFAQFDKQFGVGATPAIKKQEQLDKTRLRCG
jgi:tol-pal system protein YbgF